MNSAFEEASWNRSDTAVPGRSCNARSSTTFGSKPNPTHPANASRRAATVVGIDAIAVERHLYGQRRLACTGIDRLVPAAPGVASGEGQRPVGPGAVVEAWWSARLWIATLPDHEQAVERPVARRDQFEAPGSNDLGGIGGGQGHVGLELLRGDHRHLTPAEELGIPLHRLDGVGPSEELVVRGDRVAEEEPRCAGRQILLALNCQSQGRGDLGRRHRQGVS